MKFPTARTSATIRRALAGAALSVALLTAGLPMPGCSTLGSADLDGYRALTQGRFNRIQMISSALDLLIARPAPGNLTPAERSAWNQQTNWLMRTKGRLLAFGGELQATLDQPVPSGGTFDVDRAVATSQLVERYVRLGQELSSIQTEIGAEAAADRARIAAATPASSGSASADSLRADSLTRAGGYAYSSPLKTRHDEATSTISSLT